MQKIFVDDRSSSDGYMGDTTTTDVTTGPAPDAAARLAKKTSALADVELSMVTAVHVFQRWIVCCMEVAGLKDLSIVDVLVLHHVNHPGHCRRLADICFVLNIEDTHIVAYSLRMLIGLKVITSEKHGKEVIYLTTSSGQQFLAHYSAIRDQCLLGGLNVLGLKDAVLKELAQCLRKMSGLYDQAARAAASSL
jgi:predicted MarR family transcription regulator